MNQNDVLLAVRQRGNNAQVQVIVAMATGHGRCSRQLVPSVAKIPKYPLNLAVINRCTVVTAIAKSDQAGLGELKSGHTQARYTWPVYDSSI